MCMKYINASAKCYKSITTSNNNIMSYNMPFTGIQHEDIRGHIAISAFSIVTDINILGTNSENHKTENPLESKRTLDFIIRMTKCTSDENARIGYDLDCFSINIAELYDVDQVNRACFDFLNYTRTTNVDGLELPGGTGKYVIKILVKDSESENYTIQAMSQLTVV